MSEQSHLRMVLDSVEDFAIFTSDPDGRVELWNRGAQRLFGWSPGEAYGQHARMIFTPEDQASGAAEEEMRTAAERGRALDERWHLRKDGSRFFASGVLAALRDQGRLLGYVKIARDLTDRKALEDALRNAHDALEARVQERTAELAERADALATQVRAREAAEAEVQSLFNRLITIQEVERRRIARDIHDELGQAMTALKISLEALDTATPATDAFAALLARSRTLARDLDSAIDFLTWELRPSITDQVGLSAALSELVRSWSDRFGIAADFVSDGEHHLSSVVHEHLYRLTQEALHNVAKHAAAQHVTVILEGRDDELVLVIEDDGRGFSESATPSRSFDGGLGLTSMRERAALAGGTLTIESESGQGASISVRLTRRHATAGAREFPR